MFKKILNIFKKKEIVEEVIEETVAEEVVDIVIEEPSMNEITKNAIGLSSLTVEEVSDKFRFEVYVGTDESDFKVINTVDFKDIEEAKLFGAEYAIMNSLGEGMVMFVYEEVELENGSKSPTRYML